MCCIAHRKPQLHLYSMVYIIPTLQYNHKLLNNVKITTNNSRAYKYNTWKDHTQIIPHTEHASPNIRCTTVEPVMKDHPYERPAYPCFKSTFLKTLLFILVHVN